MPAMTDPSDALPSFQAAYDGGLLELQSGHFEPALRLHVDHPNGTPRFVYLLFEAETIEAIVIFAVVPPVDGLPCFQIGYAVAPSRRGQGRAGYAVPLAIRELRHGFDKAGVPDFRVEAVVGVANVASNRIATRAISNEAKQIKDEFSGEAAFHYSMIVPAGRTAG
jgi:hypothetical protein